MRSYGKLQSTIPRSTYVVINMSIVGTARLVVWIGRHSCKPKAGPNLNSEVLGFKCNFRTNNASKFPF